MYSKFRLALKYLQYYISASNGRGHGIHSPFVFDFVTTVLNDNKTYPVYEKVEDIRKQMLNNPGTLQIEDFGAGSITGQSTQRSVASITRYAAKPPKYGQLLYRIVRKYQPEIIFELGTSLGITTSYLAYGNKDSGNVISFEGASEIAEVAKNNFRDLGINNTQLVKGNFDVTLPDALDEVQQIDFGFIDGNHRREPTERYFRQFLKKVGPNSILVFDDIHWSREMEDAWETIKAHSQVRCSIDLFFIGIIFFRDEFREKQHFEIRF